MKSFGLVLFSFLALSQALRHIGLDRSNHLQTKLADAPQYKTSSGLSYVVLEGDLQRTGDYYATISLGSSKQNFTVIVDTGSSGLAVPSVGCIQYTLNGSYIYPTTAECYHNHTLYDPSISVTSSPVAYNPHCNQWNYNNTYCEFIVQRADGRFIVGTLTHDLFSIGGLSATAKVGKVEGESVDWSTTEGVDGIMGMAYQALDPYGSDDVFGKLASAGVVDNSFSICMGEDGGMLVLGGVDERYNAEDMQYTPIAFETYYVVEITDMKVGTYSLGSVSYGNSYVDSGTIALYLATGAFNSLVNVLEYVVCPTLSPSIQSLCNATGDDNLFTGRYCYPIDESIISTFPDITISLAEMSSPLRMTSHDYFMGIENEGTLFWCFAVGNGGSDTIMGEVLMHNYNIHFDRENSQIGFAPVQNCTQLEPLEESSSGSVLSGVSQVATLGCIIFALMFK